MLNEIYNTSKYVSNHSKSVKINFNVIDQVLTDMHNCKNFSFWLSSNPFHILDLDYKDIINFLLIYHTIGDYCFWGNPKWEVTTELGKMDGSFAVMYLALKRYKENHDFNMSFDEFKLLMQGNIEIPLLKERYDSLIIMNQFLGKTTFYNKIKDMYVDEDVFQYVIDNLPYLEDTRMYKGKKYFSIKEHSY